MPFLGPYLAANMSAPVTPTKSGDETEVTLPSPVSTIDWEVGASDKTKVKPHHFIKEQDINRGDGKALEYGHIPLEYLRTPETYRNQYFCVKKSKLGGNGAFATTDLKCGQQIHAELPTLTAGRRSIYDILEEIDPGVRDAFLRMHGHKRYHAQERRHAILMTNG